MGGSRLGPMTADGHGQQRDRDRVEIGRTAGWGPADDLSARPMHEQEGPSVFPLAYRDDRMWRRSLGCLWFPAMAALITVEEWLNVPQEAGWISLIGLFAAFLLVARWSDRKSS
jgi:hypothetical protein